jgi:acyl carrier protein
MMTDGELYAHVEAAIKTVLSVDGQSVSSGTSLSGDLGAESIDFLDISCELEKALGCEVNFKDLVKALQARGGVKRPEITVCDIVEYLRTRPPGVSA